MMRVSVPVVHSQRGGMHNRLFCVLGQSCNLVGWPRLICTINSYSPTRKNPVARVLRSQPTAGQVRRVRCCSFRSSHPLHALVCIGCWENALVRRELIPIKPKELAVNAQVNL